MKKLKDFFSHLTYMQACMAMLAAEAAILVFLMVRAVVSGGNLTYAEGVLGLVCLVLSVIGFLTPLYGHFIAQNDGKLDWRIGAVSQGVLMLFLFFLYFLGI